MTGSSGGSSQTVSQQSGPPPQVLQAYTGLVNAASGVAQQPLTQYSGPMVAGFAPQQQAAFQTIDQTQGGYVPYINAAAQEFGAATTPLWSGLPKFDTSSLPGGGIGGYSSAASAADAARAPITMPGYDTLPTYFNPYQQQVTDATRKLFNEQNAEQLAQVRGNATSQGAYGGDREAVAEALTAKQQQLAEAPTLANIQQQGFAQAQQELNTQQQMALARQQAERQATLGAGQLSAGVGQGLFGEFNTQQQQKLAADQANAWLASQAAFGLGSLGTESQNLALGGAQAELGAGGMQQQLAQELLNIPYEQFVQTQAYPYQQLGFLAPIVEGTGSLAGGTSRTTSPGPSPLSQLAGAGVAGAGVLGMTGAFGNNGWLTGSGSSGGSYIPNAYAGGLAGFGAPPYRAGGRVTNPDFHDHRMWGGGIGRMDPALGTPTVPGIDQGVPGIDLSYIPQAAPGGIATKSGLSPFQPVVTSTQSSGGGGDNPLGTAVGAVSTGLKIASLFLKDGGHVPRGTYDVGGGIGNTGTITNSGASGIGTLPAVPKINLDYIVHPGPAVKGSGPPHAPNAAPQDQGFGVKEATGLLGGLKDMKGMFGGSDSSSSDVATAAHGGRFDSGGQVPLSAAVAFGGEPPNVSQMYQQLLELPLNRLQQMAVQYPPTTQQGQLIQKVLAMKQATPGSGTSPAMPPAGIGGGPGLGATPQQTASLSTASVAQSPQDYGGTSHAMAIGGNAGDDRGYVTEDELDPHPVVDHSGDTVVIRYPSEGKTLDLGLPPIKPDHERHVAGGAVGGGSFRAANGVDIPLLSMPGDPGSTISRAGPAESIGVAPVGLGGPTIAGFQPGGGIGNWFQAMPTPYAQVGAGPHGPGGEMVFQTRNALTPQMSAVEAALSPGRPLDTWAGGSPPAAATTSPTTASTSTDPGIGAPVFDPNAAFIDPMLSAANQSGGGKRGGRVAFDDGGDVGGDDVVLEQPADEKAARAAEYQRASANIDSILGKYGPPPEPQSVVTRMDAKEQVMPGTDLALVDQAKPRPPAEPEVPAIDTARALHDPAYRQQLVPDISPPGARPPLNPADKPSMPIVDTSGARQAGEALGEMWQGSAADEAISRGVPLETVMGERARSARTEPAYTQFQVPPPIGEPAQQAIGKEPEKPTSAAVAPEVEPTYTDFAMPPAPVKPAPAPLAAAAPPVAERPRPAPTPTAAARPTATAAPPAGSPPAASPSGWIAAGDSIARGYQRFAGLGGTGVDMKTMPGADQADAAGGRSPQEVLDFIRAHPERYRGQKVLLSTGVSNDPSQAALVPEQIKALQDAHAAQIRVAGVGNRAGVEAGQQYDLRPYNQVIEGHAKAAGVEFGGALPAVVHPTRDYYVGSAKMLPAGQTAPAEPAASAPLAPADRVQHPARQGPAAVPIPSGGEAPPLGFGGARPYDPRGKIPVIRAAAEKNGINPDLFVRVAQTEGLGTFLGDNGTSGGSFQLHVTPGHTSSSVGDLFYRATGLDPLDPKNEDATIEFAAQHAAQHGWGDWNGAKRAGITGMAGIGGHPVGDIILPSGGGAPAGGPALASTATPASAGQGEESIEQARDLAHRAVASAPPEQREGMAKWINSPYFLLFLAGAGMMASRSPFPGVAIGEGLLTAGKGAEAVAGLENKNALAEARIQRVADQATAANQLADYRQQRAIDLHQRAVEQNQAALQTLQFKYDALDERQKMAAQGLDLRKQIAEASAALNAAKLDQTRQRDQWLHEYHQQVANRPTGQLAVLQALMADPNDPDRPKTVREAEAALNAARANPQAGAKLNLAIETQARLWAEQDQKAFQYNPQNVGRSFDANAAYQKHLADLRAGLTPTVPGGTAAPAPPAPPAAPATAAPAIPPRPPTVPPGSQYSPSRQQWRDPASGKIFDAQGAAAP